MTVSTEYPTILSALPAGDPVSSRQGGSRRVRPVMTQVGRTTAAWDRSFSEDTSFASNAARQTFAAPSAVLPRDVSANSTPLQVWEGTVIKIDHATSVMQVLLDAKMGQVSRHTGEIELEWVSDQDRTLVRPGAVFYLTLFKRTNPSVENAQELRFRRRPAWSASQIEQVERDAAMLGSKMKGLPTAK